VISSQKSAKNTVYDLAKNAHTIPYEVLVKLDESVRREIK
jgi:alanine racemase